MVENSGEVNFAEYETFLKKRSSAELQSHDEGQEDDLHHDKKIILHSSGFVRGRRITLGRNSSAES